MSILVKEDYANPVVPLWASAGSGGGGGGPKLLVAVGQEQDNPHLFDSPNVYEIITTYGVPSAPSTNGTFVVSATYNVAQQFSATPTFTMKLTDGTIDSLTILNLNDNPILYVGGAGSLSKAWYFGDPLPVFEMYGQTSSTGSNEGVTWTWNIVFYPNP